MSSGFVYNKVLKYKVQAELTAPLHVGSTGGDPEEVLVHPVDGRPFIQASGIAGAFREAYEQQYPAEVDSLFGSRDTETSSRIVFSDGKLTDGGKSTERTSKDAIRNDNTGLNSKSGGKNDSNVLLGAMAPTELRPRVHIDSSTGTVYQKQKILGTINTAGGKFNMQYVGAGAQLEFTTYIFTSQDTSEDDRQFRSILGILQGEGIQLGGQKSNGCGYVLLKKVAFIAFDLTKEKGRDEWRKEDRLNPAEYEEITSQIQTERTDINAYTVTLTGQTEGFLLVKALAVPEVGADAPNDQNIQNARGEYIVPGSSFKGAVRSRMTQIAAYLHMQNPGIDDQRLIENAFGTTRNGRQTGSTGSRGNLRFHDTVVGQKIENDRAPVHHRIHIDKFTGGVMNGGLFSTKDVYGKVTLKIGIQNYNDPAQTLGLLLFALRDLAAGCYNLGSGYSVGKGFISVDQIVVESPATRQILTLRIKDNVITGSKELLQTALASLRGA